MDANRTRFSLIQGARDWARCRGETTGGGLSVASQFDESNGLYFDFRLSELTLFPQLLLFPPVPGKSPLQLEQRRGAARDRFGNWYSISGDAAALSVWTEEAAVAGDFWRPGQGQACPAPSSSFQPVATPSPVALELAGLAVTEDHYLVVGVSGPKGQEGYLVFDLAAGGAPRHFLWPAGVAFAPFDMAPRVGGGVWILDRDNHRFWEIDRHFHIRRRQPDGPPSAVGAGAFVPMSPPTPRPECVCIPPALIAGADGADVPAEACAIEVLTDDLLLLLHRPGSGGSFSAVSLYREGKRVSGPLRLDGIVPFLPASQRPTFSLVAHDFAFVPRAASDSGTQVGRLYVAADSGVQSFAFDVSLSGTQMTLQPVSVYLPMRSFGGKGLVMTVRKVYYDFQDFRVPLVEQVRPSYPPSATLQTDIFDSGQPQCVWHRFLLDGYCPPDTQVQVWSRTAENLGSDGDPLAGAPWFDEPPLLRRPDGSEQPFVPASSNPDRGTFEFLFQKAQGRYLQLRVQLSSVHGRVAPRLRAIRVYYPRFSYLTQYLPAIYRDDPDSASFLDRFLANFEGLYTAIEDRIAAAQVLFDFRSAPADTLPWLASWFGVATDPAWNEYKQRVFIQHAMDFFQYRGTMNGLVMALRLVLEDAPSSHFLSGDTDDQRCAQRIRIVEKFRTRSTPGVLLGDPMEATGPRLVSAGARWLPSDGADELHRRYRQYLAANQLVVAAGDLFPVVEPDDPTEAGPWWDFLASRYGGVDWNGYLQAGAAGAINLRQALWEALGQTGPSAAPSSAAGDVQRWRDFLWAHYGAVAALNAAHGTAWTGFDQVPLPGASPDPMLSWQDWIDFVQAWNDYFSGLGASFVSGRKTVWQAFAQSALGFVPSGASDDLQAWQDYLSGIYPDVEDLNSEYGTAYDSFVSVPLPQDLPATGALREDWIKFVLQSAQLNAGTRQDLWQSFLARRYRSVDALNAAYGTSWTAFAHILVPQTLPTNPYALQDWFQFESVVLAMHATAHKFVVLLPVAAGDVNNLDERQTQLALAQRVIELEKPAHTMFEVRFYWALFRVGDARLGLDTLVGLGSRAPELLTPMILNQGFLSESILAPAPPKDMPGRFLVGTDGVGPAGSRE